MGADETNKLAKLWESRGPEATLAEQLRKWRATRGWSQQDLAERMSSDFGYGWHQTTVARIEGGNRPVRLNEAAALGLLFEIRPEELLRPPPATIRELQHLRQQEQMLLDRARALAAERHQAELLMHEAEARFFQVREAERSIMLELVHVQHRASQAREDMDVDLLVDDAVRQTDKPATAEKAAPGGDKN